jgi:hypothetical protein
MAFLAAIPAAAWLAAGASAIPAVVSGIQKSQADKFNADVMANEKSAAANQANAQEGIVRRQSREMLGRQAAAFGGAGVGYGGSSATALDQSAINQELDALNTRYKGTITGYGYGVQSGVLKRQASDDMTSGVLLAGGQALRQVSPYFGTPGGGT